MRNLLFLISFIIWGFLASAQKVYFIYFQSENNTPFYLKMNEKIYSSTAPGYVILSGLVDSTYQFTIGFPPAATEWRFMVTIAGKDKGYLLKSFSNGPGLFDLQTLNVINAQRDESGKNISYHRRSDDFSFLLAKAASDTSLLYAVVRETEDVAVIKEVPKAQTVSLQEELVKTDTATATTEQKAVTIAETRPDSGATVQTVPVTDPVDTTAITDIAKTGVTSKDTLARDTALANQTVVSTLTELLTDTAAGMVSSDTIMQVSIQPAVFKRSQVKKYAESSTSEGFGLVFFDASDEGMDTIRLIIPNPRFILNQQTDSVEPLVQHTNRVEVNHDSVITLPIVVAPSVKKDERNNCKAIASNSDFFRLRKNMASKQTDEGMVSEARKVFRTKCFSTEQIRNLSSLFLTSAGKYLFFDAAFLFVSDRDSFESLESEIKDEYFVKRFKALLDH